MSSFSKKQVLMMNKDSEAKNFKQLESEDKDLVMFTITDLRLEKRMDQVNMVMSLKRKIQTEMLTTYLPTLLLLTISYTTTFYKAIFFEGCQTVNLTIMLVMTTIFTSKIAELPPTSDTKMIDVWLIFCLLVPFSFALIQTAIECYRDENTLDKRQGKDEAWSEPIEDGHEVLFFDKSLFTYSWRKKIQDKRKDGKVQDVPPIMKSLQFTGLKQFFRFIDL